MKKKIYTIILRWSLLINGLIALFWIIWQAVFGSVPEVNSINITPAWNYALPFGLSRWWDILAGLIWSGLIIKISLIKEFADHDNLQTGLIISVVFTLTFCLVLGMLVVLFNTVAFGFAKSAFMGLIFGLDTSLVVGMLFGLIFSIPGCQFVNPTFGIGTGLAFIQAPCLIIGIIYGFSFVLGINLLFGLVIISLICVKVVLEYLVTAFYKLMANLKKFMLAR